MSQEELSQGISQLYLNTQKDRPSRLTRLKEAINCFHGSLITKNNNDSEDKGVHDVLIALNNDNKQKALRKQGILKPQLLATLGFLNNLSLSQAGVRFKGRKVEELIPMIIQKYENLCPTFCSNCEEIYDTDNDMGAECFLCE